MSYLTFTTQTVDAPTPNTGRQTLYFKGTSLFSVDSLGVVRPIDGDMKAATYDPTSVVGDAFDMDNMTEGLTAKIFLDTERDKLALIEDNADVTDTASVDAAGATMNTDTTLVGNGYFLDEDDMVSDDDTKTSSQQAIKAFVESSIAGGVRFIGGYDAATNTPDLDTSPAGIKQGDQYDISVAGDFFTEAMEVGDSITAKQDDPTLLTHWSRVQKNIDQATLTTLGMNLAAYDGIDTEANILALDPTTNLGKVYWANDVKCSLQAVTTISSGDQWQDSCVKYDEDTDTFKLSQTQDGQTLNLGQEIILPVYNDSGDVITEVAPKVLMVVKARVGDEKFKDVIKVKGSDIPEGAAFGLSTTALSVAGKGKISLYGSIGNVDTSAYSLGDILYVDPTTEGEFTNVKPVSNIYVVGRVDRVDAVSGIIFVNASGNRLDIAFVPLTIKKLNLTGDTEATTIPETFFLGKVDDFGAVAEATVVITCPDNTKVGAGTNEDTLSDVVPEAIVLNEGERSGQITISIDEDKAQEKIYMEVYAADDQGVAIESGILTEAIGDLGVRPIVTLESSILDMKKNIPLDIEIKALITEDYTLAANNRLRFHPMAEKIGADGGDKDVTFLYGSDHNSFINELAEVSIDDVAGLQDALDARLPRILEVGSQALPYTILDTDTGKHIELTGSGALTIPTGLPIGTQFSVGLNNAVKQPLTTAGNTVKTINASTANISGNGMLSVAVTALNELRLAGDTGA